MKPFSQRDANMSEESPAIASLEPGELWKMLFFTFGEPFWLHANQSQTEPIDCDKTYTCMCVLTQHHENEKKQALGGILSEEDQKHNIVHRQWRNGAHLVAIDQ